VDRRVSFVAASAVPEHPNPCTAVTNTRYPTDGVLHRSQQLHEIVDVKFIHRDFAIGPRGLARQRRGRSLQAPGGPSWEITECGSATLARAKLVRSVKLRHYLAASQVRTRRRRRIRSRHLRWRAYLAWRPPSSARWRARTGVLCSVKSTRAAGVGSAGNRAHDVVERRDHQGPSFTL